MIALVDSSQSSEKLLYQRGPIAQKLTECAKSHVQGHVRQQLRDASTSHVLTHTHQHFRASLVAADTLDNLTEERGTYDVWRCLFNMRKESPASINSIIFIYIYKKKTMIMS